MTIGVFDHPWLQGLFGDAEAAHLWSPDQQIRHMLAVEAAYTMALGRVGALPAARAETVARQIAAFAPDREDLRQGSARDGLPVPALVAQLTKAIGNADGAIHRGMTSQDVIDSAQSLTLRGFNDLLDNRLTGLSAALGQLAQRFGGAPLMGRTRMQAAMPLTVADRVATWHLPLAQHQCRLQHLRPKVELLQLGGAVGTGVAPPAQARALAADMAAQLGLGIPPRPWHAMREGLVDHAGLLSAISGSLGKMGQDICLMAQQGVDEIALSGGGGSSAMPHKQNPVLAELLVTLARFNATQISGMHQALVHEQERSGTAWALEWMILPQMAQATARSLSAALALCAAITRMGGEMG